jgi:flagellar biosynthesis anti-sigma factor FlgM
MHISRPNSEPASGLNPAPSVAPPDGNSPSQQAVRPDAISDSAQLSALGGILASALQGSPAHVAKVSELGAAVSSGRYRVDANAVSGSIIDYSLGEHSLGRSGLAFGGAGLPGESS